MAKGELSTRVVQIVLRCFAVANYGKFCMGGQWRAFEDVSCATVPEGSVTSDEYIRELCARITTATSDEEVITLCDELRKAVREHTQSVRGKLIRASSLPQHPGEGSDPTDPKPTA